MSGVYPVREITPSVVPVNAYEILPSLRIA